MNTEDKLTMYHERQFLCLLHLVREGILNGSISSDNSLYKLYLKNKKLEENTLKKLLNNI